MTRQVTKKNLIQELRSTFPELESAYQLQVNECAGDDLLRNYEIFGRIFKPKLKDELAKGEITEFLRRAATFFERVCTSRDTEAINIIWVKIFEWLIFRREELHLLWPALGPCTKATIRDAAERWSEAERYFGHTRG